MRLGTHYILLLSISIMVQSLELCQEAIDHFAKTRNPFNRVSSSLISPERLP